MDLSNIQPSQLAWLVSGRESHSLSDAIFKNCTLRDVLTNIVCTMLIHNMILEVMKNGKIHD